MPVLNANIRTFNSYAESPKLYNFVFVAHAWRVPWGEKCKLDSGRLRRKRRSPQAWRPSEEPRPVLYPGGGLGSPFHWLQTNLVQPSPRWALGTQARLHFCPWPLCLNPHGQVTLKGILKSVSVILKTICLFFFFCLHRVFMWRSLWQSPGLMVALWSSWWHLF